MNYDLVIFNSKINRKIIGFLDFFDKIYLVGNKSKKQINRIVFINENELKLILKKKICYSLVVEFEEYDLYNRTNHQNLKKINYSESLCQIHFKSIFRNKISSIFNSKYFYFESKNISNLKIFDNNLFPLYFKPDLSAGSRGNKIINNIRELSQLQTKGVLEPYIKFKHTGGIGLYVKNGVIKAYQLNKRLKTYPRKGGVSIIGGHESTELSEFIHEEAKEICLKLNLSGLFMLEYGILKDNSIYWIECNSRLWGSYMFNICSNIHNPTRNALSDLGIKIVKKQKQYKKYIFLNPKSLYFIKCFMYYLIGKTQVLPPRNIKEVLLLTIFRK
jgi:hypothetical protein